MEILYRDIETIRPSARNPRRARKEAVERLAESIRQNPQFFEARPILLSDRTGVLTIIGGDRRYEAARSLGLTHVPTILLHGLSEREEDEVMIKDNTHAGVWDAEKLAAWDAEVLQTWGLDDVGETDPARMNLRTDVRDGDEAYQDFVEKFKPKLTTDDCYTPSPVYEALLDWVDRTLGPVDRSKVVRPFYPGGDYRRADYPEGCIVIDNPPFSIYAEIVRFYLERGVTFFLFGPHLTLRIQDADVTYVLAGVSVTYENGAEVSTSFVTNMPAVRDYRIIIPVALYRAIREADEASRGKVSLSRYNHPLELWTLPVLSKIAKGEQDYYVPKDQVEQVRNLDCLKAQGKSLFGGGFLFSSAAAREAAAREAADLELSDREKAIVAMLDARNRYGESTDSNR